ncbi:tectonic-3-like [Penaeus monodon]|uniref:tectonic-3-like n=1 Tax=Penaeus monodon TaxID=6687 RepID=UPI0018A70F91|nr:tectonic-3-like [Penaeus monodon]
MTSVLRWHLSVLLALYLVCTFIPNINAEDEGTNPMTSTSHLKVNNTLLPEDEIEETDDFNSTAKVPSNFTSNGTDTDYEDMDNGTYTTEYPEENITTPSTELPATLLPGTNISTELIVDDFCLCDLKVGYCDINCCCDEDCDADDRLVFSHCLERPQNILDPRYCFQQRLIFSNNTEYTVEYNDGGVFCIVTDNLPERTTYTAVKGATNIEEFEDLQKEEPHYSWVQNQPSLKFSEEPYVDGSPLWGFSYEGFVFNIGIPDSVVGSECEAETGMRFLQDFRSSCYRVFHYLPEDCQINQKLNALHYLSFYVIADPSNLYQNASSDNSTEAPTVSPTTTESPSEETTTDSSATSDPPETVTPLESESTTTSSANKQLEKTDVSEGIKAAMMDITSVEGLTLLEEIVVDQMQLLPINVSLCHWENSKEICVNIPLTNIPQPLYINGICQNVVSNIFYQFTHNGTEGLSKVHAKVHLTNISSQMTQSSQTFETKYMWASSEDLIIFERSGRPGYVYGKPLLLGKHVENVTEEGDLKEAIILDIDPENWLTILSPGPEGACNHRTQVTFGQDIRSGCAMKVTQDDLANRCQALQKKFQELLLGPVLLSSNGLRIASFGDSNVNNAADWVPILIPEKPRAASFSSSILGKTKCAELVLSMHLEIAFSLQGALANPQAKVVGIVLRYGEPQDIAITCTGPSCQNQTVPIELVSSVSFVDVTQSAHPAFAQPPRLDLKLPYDFFYPFLPSSSMPVCERNYMWVFVLISCVLFV